MKLSSVARVVNHCVEVHRPVFLWGPPGVGKSDIVAQVAANSGRMFEDVRLSMMDPTDVKGFPVPNRDKGVMEWLPADCLPPMFIDKEVGKGRTKTIQSVPNDTKGILFLDELNSAPPATQAAAYQLILNRRVGKYVLPDGWDIVAAGNRDGDRGVTHRMPSPLRSRFVHIDVELNVDEWVNWAVENGVDPKVIAFIRFRTNLLHTYDAKTDPRSYGCPRTWKFVSDLISAPVRLPAADELELFKGTVGDAAAAEFKAFLEVAEALPTIDEVMMNPKSARVPAASEMAALYAVSTMVATYATRDNVGVLMDYTKRLPVEFQVVMMRDAGRRDNTVTQAKVYTDWVLANNDMFR